MVYKSLQKSPLNIPDVLSDQSRASLLALEKGALQVSEFIGHQEGDEKHYWFTIRQQPSLYR
jgi:hypothetical protein